MSNKKVILVTGASSGIGYQTAEQLAKEGHIVYGAARRVDAMKPLEAFGVTPVSLDITDEASIKEALNLIIKKENRIDVLVNNAGYGSYGAVENVTIEEAKMQFEVNIFGLARLTQLVLPYMRKQKSGRIINVGSMGGRLTSYFGAYEAAATKAAEGMRKQYSGNMMSNPKVISNAISKAVNSRCPKTRYLVGMGAKPLVFLHAILPDRWFDALMKRAS